jgi:RNA polymerase sigma-70 factor (ECF subfamily)
MDAPEQAIYRAAIQGDRDAFEIVIRSTSRNLFAIAYGILQSREEAEDVVQDTFVKAWKARLRVRDSAKFPAWLATIARHRARDLARKRGPERLPEDFESNEVVEFEVAATGKRADLDGEVRSALAQLPELHRAAVTLRYFEDLDYGTIEQTLGLTNGALRGILGRALGRMRKRLKPALAAIG